MALRVVQWATGGVGRAAIAGVLAHPELELVGCWVHAEDKVGRDAGELAGIDPVGVTATSDVDALLAREPDAIVYAPLLPDAELVARMLASGANVVTPLGWFFPGDRDIARVEAACREGGTTLHGTGIHPGGITEKFPLLVSALSSGITHVRAEEFSDIRSYDAPFVVGDVMLFGKRPEQVVDSPMPALLTDGFTQSIEMIAAAVGFALDGPPTVEHASAVATVPIPDTPIGTIPPGHVAGQRFVWRGTVGGTPVVTVQVNWLMGQEHLDPGWDFGPAGERFEVEVSGDPSSTVTFHGWHPDSVTAGRERNPGIVATANHCVSSIPAVCGADPGIRTYLDLPLVTGRAAPHLR